MGVGSRALLDSPVDCRGAGVNSVNTKAVTAMYAIACFVLIMLLLLLMINDDGSGRRPPAI